jgi:hypothetical protein
LEVWRSWNDIVKKYSEKEKNISKIDALSDLCLSLYPKKTAIGHLRPQETMEVDIVFICFGNCNYIIMVHQYFGQKNCQRRTQ